MAYEVGKWYGWNGYSIPFDNLTVVDVITEPRERFGDVSLQPPRRAWNYNWGDGVGMKVIAFRIITPYTEPPKPREFWISTATRKAYNYLSSLRMEEGDYADYIKVTEDFK